MGQLQTKFKKAIVRGPTSLDTLPEETSLEIIRYIQEWAEIDGSLEARERGRSNPQSGALIKSICFLQVIDFSNSGTIEQIELFTPFYNISGRTSINSGIQESVHLLYLQLNKVSTITILDDYFLFPSQVKIFNYPFLTTSLKKLYVPLWGKDRSNLNVKNVVWLLSFCRQLTEASLAAGAFLEDFDFVSEHQVGFSQVSNIQKLALSVEFLQDQADQRTWWPRDGNKKSELLVNILSVAQRLNSLEIGHTLNSHDMSNDRNLGPVSGILSSIRSSFQTLKHLRIIGIGAKRRGDLLTDLSVFSNLRILSLDQASLISFSKTPHVKFPPNVEILVITHYHCGTDEPVREQAREEFLLATILKSRSLPRLRQIIVPSSLIDLVGNLSASEEVTQVWRRWREELKKTNALQSGEVQLREIGPGEQIGNGGDFLSTLRWLSP